MGLFDYVRSSYKFTDEFNDNTCFQTKDLDCSLVTYYIDPSGVIWKPDYVGTNDIVFLEPGDPEYNENLSFFNTKWVPTGKRGRYKPFNITDYVTIYIQRKKDNVRTDIRIHFFQGIIQNYKVNHYQRYSCQSLSRH
jgi:hypothetical protein